MRKQSTFRDPRQIELGGAQASAVQLAKAREAEGRGKIRPRAPQCELASGLFAPPPAPDLFDTQA